MSSSVEHVQLLETIVSYIQNHYDSKPFLSQTLAKVVTGTRNPAEAKQLYRGEQEEEDEE